MLEPMAIWKFVATINLLTQKKLTLIKVPLTNGLTVTIAGKCKIISGAMNGTRAVRDVGAEKTKTLAVCEQLYKKNIEF
jgi:hypothetical protein